MKSIDIIIVSKRWINILPPNFTQFTDVPVANEGDADDGTWSSLAEWSTFILIAAILLCIFRCDLIRIRNRSYSGSPEPTLRASEISAIERRSHRPSTVNIDESQLSFVDESRRDRRRNSNIAEVHLLNAPSFDDVAIHTPVPPHLRTQESLDPPSYGTLPPKRGDTLPPTYEDYVSSFVSSPPRIKEKIRRQSQITELPDIDD